MRVNIQELADIIGVSRPTITSWIDDGLPYAVAGSKGKPWQFDTADALPWWAENKHRRRSRPLPGHDPFADPGEGPETIEEAERRKMVANADKAELELAKAAGLVVEIAEVAQVTSEMHARIRTRLLGIGNQIRMQVRAFLGGDRAAEEQVVAAAEGVIADAMAEIRDDVFAEEGEVEETEETS
jgi:phage terminase Nu1 subunit (DNA packaging protein)